MSTLSQIMLEQSVKKTTNTIDAIMKASESFKTLKELEAKIQEAKPYQK